ncbi:hypothetical protein ES703_98474 [subsurface metagenome]
MIISASRRTDIPAFYAEWFMNRIHVGYCTVPNPFNRNQVSYISLKPEDVDVIVFWTRHPRPLFPHLKELDQRGYRYYFQYTLMNNPRQIDPKSPPPESSMQTFHELADRIGPEKVIWRYDPILFSKITDAEFHQKSYRNIAQALRGYTGRSVISIVDIYRKAEKRFRELASQGVEIMDCEPEAFGNLMSTLVGAAIENDMEIVTCAEEPDLQIYGIRPGKCVDDKHIQRIFGLDGTHKKDPSQRKSCGCVVSKDIGIYDSCLFGCVYCYATSSFERAKVNHGQHEPISPSLIGWHDAFPKPEPSQQGRPWDTQ